MDVFRIIVAVILLPLGVFLRIKLFLVGASAPRPEVSVNRFFLLLSLGILAGCQIYVTPTPELRVLTANLATNYRTADGTSVICDNRATTLLYSFRYEGQLNRWTSYLKGQTLGEVKGERSFTPGSQGVVAYEQPGYEVQYVMDPNFAPYLTGVADRALAPSAIDIVPVPQPTRIGATKLYLTLEGADQKARFVSRDIPVIINCP